jgi:hypothetical protein
MEVSLSKIINVTLMATPQGLPGFNVNSLALFTDETPNVTFGDDGYKIYRDPGGVLTDFGLASDTYKQAVAIFSQTPNILTGNGYLVVIPLKENAEATAGIMQTLAPGALEAFQLVEDGAFKISFDGVEKSLTDLDFSDAEDLDDVATVIDTALTGGTCAYVASANSGQGAFLFTSSTTGVDSKVTKLSAPAAGTDLSGETYLNGTGNVKIVNGKAALSAEDIVEAVERTKLEVFYFGILSTISDTVENVLNFAAYMQTQDKLAFIGRNDAAEIDTLFKVIQQSGLTHTRCLLYTIGEADAREAVAAYASRLFGINWAGSNTMCTMNLKQLAGITPDPDAASDNIDQQATLYGFDIYVSVAGYPAVLSYGANGYADQIYGQLWLKLALQVAGFNHLAMTNTKIPQTEPGMSGLKGAFASVCLQGIRNGYLASGLTWTNPTTFGNPEDLRRNITDAGYYIYSLPIAQQSAADRNSRKAPLVQIAVKEAGAIHSADVIVQIS